MTISTVDIDRARSMADTQDTEQQHLVAEEWPDLFSTLRGSIPVPGNDHNTMHLVVVPPGRSIGSHAHKEWVALLYVDPAGTPIEIEGTLYMPQPGEVLVLPPGTYHAVPPNKAATHRRISIALKVRDVQ